MDNQYALHRGARQHDLLHQLIREKDGLATDGYTLFFVTGEGRNLPISRPGDDVEEMSGYVLDQQGRVFFFWFGWDPAREAPALIRWRRAEPQPHWEQSAEYRRARERMQLPCA